MQTARRRSPQRCRDPATWRRCSAGAAAKGLLRRRSGGEAESRRFQWANFRRTDTTLLTQSEDNRAKGAEKGCRQAAVRTPSLVGGGSGPPLSPSDSRVAFPAERGCVALFDRLERPRPALTERLLRKVPLKPLAHPATRRRQRIGGKQKTDRADSPLQAARPKLILYVMTDQLPKTPPQRAARHRWIAASA